jgi:glycosyltransferase involved in cell wall biosynthesis
MGTTAVILTFNEEENIRAALDSIDWCDERIIVDSQSTDKTREIARSCGARIVDAPRTDPEEPFDHFRNLGIEAASNDLIVFIDADEIHPVPLQEWLQKAAKRQKDDIGVIRAPILEFIGDTPVPAGRLDYTAVLVNQEKIQIKKKVHNFMSYDETVREDIPANRELAIRHTLADSLYDHWKDQRRYARIAADNREFKPLKIILAPLWGFYIRVIHGKGWRDGILGIGIGLCYSWFLFETHFRVMLRELNINK